MEYYTVVKNILKVANKLTEMEKKILSEVTQFQKDKWFVLTHNWILGIDQRITSLQSTIPEKLSNKEDPKRDIYMNSPRNGK